MPRPTRSDSCRLISAKVRRIMEWFPIARVEEIPPGRTLYREVHGYAILLVNYRGTFHALGGICPHQDRPMVGASLWEDKVECPWHHFQFEILTGENHYPRNVYPKGIPELEKQVRPLPKYRVLVRDGVVYISLPATEGGDRKNTSASEGE